MFDGIIDVYIIDGVERPDFWVGKHEWHIKSKMVSICYGGLHTSSMNVFWKS